MVPGIHKIWYPEGVPDFVKSLGYSGWVVNVAFVVVVFVLLVVVESPK